MPELLIFSLVVLLAVSVLLWWQQCRSRNAGWVDVFWSLAVGITGLGYLLSGWLGGQSRPLLVVAAGLLLMLWSLRLAGHLYQRLAAEGREEGRYAAMRSALGSKAQPVFLGFYLGQALLAWLFSLPFWVIAAQQSYSPLLLVLAVLVGVGAIAGEALADRQLRDFKTNPAHQGKTCRQGLWRYSRHPNYFFEWLHWLSYPLMAVGASGAGWLWLLPVAMLLFLWFVTGIPYTEKQAIKSRGDDYRHYQATTSPFFPWRPRQ